LYVLLNRTEGHGLTGIVVIIPELFDGDPIPLNRPGDFDIVAWRDGKYHPNGKAHAPENIDPIVDACIKELRTKYGIKVCPGIPIF
jgi:hypothetical protein